jgi:hypothetical protein
MEHKLVLGVSLHLQAINQLQLLVLLQILEQHYLVQSFQVYVSSLKSLLGNYVLKDIR